MLIAESGSTKTDWRWIDDSQNVHQLQTLGMNPNYSSQDEILKILSKVINTFPNTFNEPLYFYGSGCEFITQDHWLYNELANKFGDQINIFGDTLAAARASLNNEDGISVILGTGANVSLFQNQSIQSSYSGYGFLIGDEGSGAYMGKLLLKDYLEDKCPQEVVERMQTFYKWNKKIIIDQLYNQPQPNRFMANLSIYIYKNRKNEYFKSLILKNFNDFFRTNILPYPELRELPIGAVGSIAYFYELYLKYKAEEYGYNIRKIVQSPIAALTLYHSNS